MELGQDWGAFQSILYPGKKSRRTGSEPASQPVLAAASAGVAIRIYSDQEELGDLALERIEQLPNHLTPAHVLGTFDCGALDDAINASLKSGNGVLKQLAHLRENLRPLQGKIPSPAPNFLLEATHGWWSKFLPSSYGIFLSLDPLEGQPARSLLLLIRKGVLDQFDEPDLSSLSQERRKDPAEVVKYLREKYATPVQGVSLAQADWEEWCRLRNPWKAVTKGLRANRVHLIPFRWSIASLVGARGIFG